MAMDTLPASAGGGASSTAAIPAAARERPEGPSTPNRPKVPSTLGVWRAPRSLLAADAADDDARSIRSVAAAEEEGIYRWPELICVYVAIISDAIVQNVIAPYAVSWVRDSFPDKDSNVGLYAGLLVGSFSFASALTSPFFGWLSDIIGRRILMAGGLAAAGVLTLIGGLASSYWVTFSMRFMAGLLDASQTVSFAAIGDLTTGRARFVAFGYSKAASQIARILTSMIGGFTYNLAPDPVFKNWPGYNTVLLSHLIAFGSCLVGVALIVAFYREGPEFNHVVKRIKHVHWTALQDGVAACASALPSRAPSRAPSHISLSSLGFSHSRQASNLSLASLAEHEEVEDGAAASAAAAHRRHRSLFFASPPGSPMSVASVASFRRRMTPLGISSYEPTFDDEPTLLTILKSHLSTTTPAAAASAAAEAEAAAGDRTPIAGSGAGGGGAAAAAAPHAHPPPFLHTTPSTWRRPSQVDISSASGGHEPSSASVLGGAQAKPSFGTGLRYVLTNRLLMLLIGVYSLTSFLNGGLFLSIMLLAQEDKGYDMSPKEASIINLLMGSYAIFFNALCFKPVVARLGQKRANGMGLLLTGFGVLGLPIADAYIRSHTVQLWLVIVPSVIIYGSGFMLINSILASFISTHAKPEMQGVAQGVAIFASQILSGLGPMAFGALNNAIPNPIGVFLCLTTGYSLAFAILHAVPRPVLEKEEGADD